MTQARRAQRRIKAKEIISPREAEGYVDLEVGPNGETQYFFPDKSMIMYAQGSHWPDVWTLSYQIKNLNRLRGQAATPGHADAHGRRPRGAWSQQE